MTTARARALAEPAVVYFHRDKDGHVLYIGATIDLAKRTQRHQHSAEWWPLVASVTVESKHPNWIQWRLKAARTYPKDSQIRSSTTDYASWTALVDANFPTLEAPADEPLADWRTEVEKRRDRNRDLAERSNNQDQLSMFPLDMFEPTESTVKDLHAHAAEMLALAERHLEHAQLRVAYVARLLAAVGGDESVTWAAAHLAAFGAPLDEATP